MCVGYQTLFTLACDWFSGVVVCVFGRCHGDEAGKLRE